MTARAACGCEQPPRQPRHSRRGASSSTTQRLGERAAGASPVVSHRVVRGFTRVAPYRWLLCWGLSLWALLSGAPLYAKTLVLDDVETAWELGDYAEYWVDDGSAARSLDDVQSVTGWRPVGKPRMSLGLRRGVLWLRVSVREALTTLDAAASPNFRVEFSHPRPIALTAYVPRGGAFVEVRTGLVAPLSEREVRSRSVVVPFHLKPGEEAVLYFRLDTAPMGFSGVVTSSGQSARQEEQSSFALGLYYGIALGLFLYNAFLWLTLRSASYGWYLLFLSTTVVFFAARNGFIWAWGWTPDSGFGGGALVGLQMLAVLQFARRLLGTDVGYPRIDRLSRGGVLLCLASIAITAIWPSQTTETAVAPLAAILLMTTLVVAAHAAWNGNRLARMFVLAWAVYLGGAFLYVLKSTGHIPHTPVTEHAMQVGSALEMSLLSLALAERVRSLRNLARRREREVTMLKLENERNLVALREESAQRLMAAQDAHSQRLAEDLHDSVGHRFLLIERMASSMETGRLDPEFDEARAAIVATAREGVEETREIAHGLYPQRLVVLGLEASLGAAADALSRAGIPVQSEVEPGVSARLDEAARLSVLRIAEEALQNAARHADAGALRLTWRTVGTGDCVELSIADDGKGLAHEASTEGLGFVTMRDRALQLGATLEVDSQPGEGTRVRLVVPLLE